MEQSPKIPKNYATFKDLFQNKIKTVGSNFYLKSY